MKIVVIVGLFVFLSLASKSMASSDSTMDCYDPAKPPQIKNAICVLESSHEMEAFTRWRCNCSDGYSLEVERNQLVFCYPDNATSPQLPVCRKSCYVPTPYHGRWINGEIGAEVLHGDSIIERCLQPPPGLKQARILVCRDGAWSSVWLSVSCALELCAPTPLLAGSNSRCFQGVENVTLTPIGSTRTTQCFEGSRAVYWCKEGYAPGPLSGGHKSAHASCGFGGNWSPITPQTFRCEYIGGGASSTLKNAEIFIVFIFALFLNQCFY